MEGHDKGVNAGPLRRGHIAAENAESREDKLEELADSKAKLERDMTAIKVEIEQVKKEAEKKEKSPSDKLIDEKILGALKERQGAVQFDWIRAARALEDFEARDVSQNSELL